MSKNKSKVKVIYKKKPSEQHSFHGGSWKLAYADFVTALMAFFLLLWLLNATPNKKLKSIAQNFMPTLDIIKKTIYSHDIGVQYGVKRVGEIVDIDKNGDEINIDEVNNKIFAKIESQIDQNADNIKNISYKNSLTGLEIVINNQENNSLFNIGSAKLTDYAKDSLNNIISFIKYSPNLIQISDYTNKLSQNSLDGNWELSAHRADSIRKYLLIKGISLERMNSLVAKADTDLLDEEDLYSPKNQRVVITLLREHIVDNYKVSIPNKR